MNQKQIKMLLLLLKHKRGVKKAIDNTANNYDTDYQFSQAIIARRGLGASFPTPRELEAMSVAILPH